MNFVPNFSVFKLWYCTFFEGPHGEKYGYCAYMTKLLANSDLLMHPAAVLALIHVMFLTVDWSLISTLLSALPFGAGLIKHSGWISKFPLETAAAAAAGEDADGSSERELRLQLELWAVETKTVRWCWTGQVIIICVLVTVSDPLHILQRFLIQTPEECIPPRYWLDLRCKRRKWCENLKM